MSFEIFLLVWAFLLGLIVGSYLNVVIHRIPRGISTVLPRSRCPGCGAAIRIWDNLPLVSYLWLRGRCRHCGMAIPLRYLLVELTTGLAFVACFAHFGAGVEGLVGAVFAALLIALAVIDLEHFLLPDRITLPGLVAGLVLQPWIPQTSLREALLGAGLGGALILLVSAAWYLLRGEEGMGLGDAKMLAMVGAFLGWKGMVVTLFLGFSAGAVVGLVLLATGRGGVQSRLPFGTFLAGAALVALLYGPALAEAYLGLLVL